MHLKNAKYTNLSHYDICIIHEASRKLYGNRLPLEVILFAKAIFLDCRVMPNTTKPRVTKYMLILYYLKRTELK